MARGIPFFRLAQVGLAVRGMDVGELAVRCGISKSHMSRVLNDASPATAEMQLRVFATLGFPPGVGPSLLTGVAPEIRELRRLWAFVLTAGDLNAVPR